jgi:hypothetical protein
VTMLGKQVPLAGPGFSGALESFPKLPGTAYGFLDSVSCPGGRTAGWANKSANTLHRAHLRALLPSGAR